VAVFAVTPHDIARLRLANQQITVHASKTPQQVVGALGGAQAQDYRSALWAIGLRLSDASQPDIEEALANGSIVRTWAMRGTLHFVSSADVRWMIALLAPRVIAASAYRRRQLEIDGSTLSRSRDVLVGVLSNGRQVARDEAMRLLEGAGVQTRDQRGIHILRHLSLEGLLCQTTAKRNQATFRLLDEWVPKSEKLSRDAALAELAYRYFSSHGPATLPDFRWWAGLTQADAEAGLELIKARRACEKVANAMYWLSPTTAAPQPPGPVVCLLPAFDEYVLGYADRGIALDTVESRRVVHNGGVFRPTIVVDGHVVGTWQPGRATRARTATGLFSEVDTAVSDALGVAVRDYDVFANESAASA
jgi:hypothetical protein